MHLDPSRLGETRSDWTLAEVTELHALPFTDLLWHAQAVHRRHFDPNEVQVSTLLSIKTGGCSEDCGYCSQSARYKTEVGREALLDVKDVLERARAAREPVRRASAWAPPGAARRTARSSRCSRWCAA